MDMNKLSRFLTIAQQSEHDGERLSAFNLACKMLAAEKLTFADILLKLPAEQPRWTPPPPPQKSEHRQMLDDLLDPDQCDHNERTQEFLESLLAGIKRFGSLTPKQAAALERIHERHFP